MFYLQILTTHQAIQTLLYRNQKTFLEHPTAPFTLT